MNQPQKKTNKFEYILKTNAKIYLQVLPPMSQVCQLSGQDLSLITYLVLTAHRASDGCGSIKKTTISQNLFKIQGLSTWHKRNKIFQMTRDG